MRQDTDPAFHIDADDLPSGYLLSRREALTLLGGVGAAAAVLSARARPCWPSRPARRHRPQRERRPPLLRHPARADRGPVLRRGRAGAVRHPGRQRRRQRVPGCPPGPDVPRVADRRHRLYALRGGPRGRLALRCHGCLLGRQPTPASTPPATTSCGASSAPTPRAPRRSRPSIPAGTRAGRSTSTSRSGPTRTQSAGTELTSQLFFDDTFTDARVPRRAVCQQGHPDPPQRRRRHLPAEWRPDPGQRDPDRRWLPGHIPDRRPDELRLSRSDPGPSLGSGPRVRCRGDPALFRHPRARR